MLERTHAISRVTSPYSDTLAKTNQEALGLQLLIFIKIWRSPSPRPVLRDGYAVAEINSYFSHLRKLRKEGLISLAKPIETELQPAFVNATSPGKTRYNLYFQLSSESSTPFVLPVKITRPNTTPPTLFLILRAPSSYLGHLKPQVHQQQHIIVNQWYRNDTTRSPEVSSQMQSLDYFHRIFWTNRNPHTHTQAPPFCLHHQQHSDSHYCPPRSSSSKEILAELESWKASEYGMGLPAPTHSSHHHCAKWLREPWTQLRSLKQRGRGQKGLRASLSRDHRAENQTPPPSSNSTSVLSGRRHNIQGQKSDSEHNTPCLCTKGGN